MKSYTIDAKKYYLADTLMLNNPSLFKGCKNNSRNIVTKKNIIPENKYIFAKKVKSDWIKTDGSSKKFDKLFVSKRWYDNYDIIETEPDLIYLEDNEMFTDMDGNVFDICVRGERKFDKCYFSVEDIINRFHLKSLKKVIMDKRFNGYVENVHYKYFYPKNKKTKNLYLTYMGILRLLFSSNRNNAEKFARWCAEILFTYHIGNIKQKHDLASKLIGVSSDAIKSVFNKTAIKVPVIYLFSIGIVKKLTTTLSLYSENDYNDDDYVCKWGMTKDFERRTKEHEITYGKLKNSNLRLLIFGYIDPQYISEAETKVKRLIESMNLKLEHEKYNELAIIPKNKMKTIKENFEMISKVYMGHITELVNKIKEKDIEKELTQVKYEKELQKEIYEKELLKKEYEILKKDLELAQLKSKK